jgi:hypothetical protein
MGKNKDSNLEGIPNRYSFKLVVALVAAIYALIDLSLAYSHTPVGHIDFADLLFRVGVIAALVALTVSKVALCVTRTKLRFGLLNHYLYNTTNKCLPNLSGYPY